MYKTYIADGREYFIYGDIKKDFPFPESLLRFLYLDDLECGDLLKRVASSLGAYYISRDEGYLREAEAGLDALGDNHIFFAFLREQWQEKPEPLRVSEELSEMAAAVAGVQLQIRDLIAAVLDKDGPTETLEQYAGAQGQAAYLFRKLSVRYEMTDVGMFTDVLYPDSVYDIIDFFLSACLKGGVQMRICKNCGRYFALTGKASAEYCDITVFENGRTCKDVGAMRVYTKNKNSNEIFKEYRREYKRRFAQMKNGRLDADAFYAWGAEARQKESACERGEISFEEFKRWLDR